MMKTRSLYRLISLVSVALAISIAPSAFAQIAPMPSDAAIEDAIRAQKQRTAETLNKMPGSLPNKALPKPLAAPIAPGGANAAMPDLGALVDQYNGAQRQAEKTNNATPTLMVFVSLSMPKATLDRLIDQAVQFQVPLTIRGLKDASFKGTVDAIAAVLGKRNAQIQIDPRLFDRFAINKVPAVVVVDAASGTSATAFGDVSLDYALESIERSVPAVAATTALWLKRGKRRLP
jgi:conjugal transfer pilus assembly protein TrbC